MHAHCATAKKSNPGTTTRKCIDHIAITKIVIAYFDALSGAICRAALLFRRFIAMSCCSIHFVAFIAPVAKRQKMPGL